MVMEKEVTLGESIQEINVADIDQTASRIRQRYDEESIEELMRTIEQEGLINPITVCKALEGFELVAGFRRLRAVKTMNLQTIPARIVDRAHKDKIALIENIHREALHPVDEAEALYNLMQVEQCGQARLAEMVGKSQPWVSSTLALRDLPACVKDEIDFSIPKGVLIEITKLKDPEIMVKAWEELREAGTVAAARQIVARLQLQGEGPSPAEAGEAELDDEPSEGGPRGGPRKVYFKALLTHGESVQRGLRDLNLSKLKRERTSHLKKMLMELQVAIKDKLDEIDWTESLVPDD